MRYTLEPVTAQHKSVLVYVMTGLLLPAITTLRLRCLGFHRVSSAGHRFWVREGDGLPIIFAHGIGEYALDGRVTDSAVPSGVGILPYQGILCSLFQLGCPLILVDNPTIAVQVSLLIIRLTEN